MKTSSSHWFIVWLLIFSVVVLGCSSSVIAQSDEPGTPTPLPVPETLIGTLGTETELDFDAALERLRNYDGRLSFQTTRIYDRHGVLLDEIYGEGQRTWVPLEKIPQSLIQATIATEDRTFYTNAGIDPLAIGRALLQNTQAGEIVSGASTITQQLVRLIVFPYEQRVRQEVSRKVNEGLLATRLTRMWSKHKILETYLNEVYYGHQAYGVGAAAKTYFDKPVSALNLAESSLLAGLPQSPNRLDPHKDFDAAKQRQAQVLRLMVEAGYITQAEADAAYAQPLVLMRPKRIRRAPHFVDYIQRVLENAYGYDAVRQGGLQVTTTLDLRYQTLIEDMAREHVDALREQHQVTNASVIVMQPQTGQILAMLGSVDYDDAEIDGQVNVAVRPRQPGSAIKPITYVAAFEKGYTPASVVLDEPTEFPLDNGQVYQPSNYDEKFHGPVRLREALANSYNVPAVKVLDEVGISFVADKAHAMGITGLEREASYYGLSLTLGGGEVSLLDLTTAYATLANGGGYVPPAPVLKIVDGTGNVIYEYQQLTPRQVVAPGAAFLVTDILSDNEARRPAFGQNNALEFDRPVAVKTGTTTDWRDAWTLGYTPYLVMGVWAGNADNSPMDKLPGSRGAAPLFHKILESILDSPSLQDVLMVDGRPLHDGFEVPPNIVEAEICDLDSLSAGTGCGQTRLEKFVDGTVPAEGDEAYVLAKLAEENYAMPITIPGVGSATWYISSPRPGDVIKEPVPVVGTAQFNPAEISFFKVEFASAHAPINWITMGETHQTPVQNGQLEMWYAGGLPPGSYTLRLVLVKPDGNWLPPYEVPVRVER